MTITVQELCRGFDFAVDKVRQLSKDFCSQLGITTFAYVRIYEDGRVSWVTSNPEQDRFLIDSGALNEDPLVNTPEALKEGHYLWFHDRQFPGSEAFYRDRAKLFQMDHGMVIIKRQKKYLETCCFSGLLAKAPLYNLFMNKKELFNLFMDHFVKQTDRRLLSLLEKGITIGDIKKSFGPSSAKKQRELTSCPTSLLALCGCKYLAKLSKREKECLVLLKQGFNYRGIGSQLKLSPRTVEHYLESVRNKLGIESRSELFLVAENISKLN